MPFDVPFEWDPKCGPLALDIRLGGGSTITVTDWDTQTGFPAARMLWANSRNATQASGHLTRVPAIELILDTDVAPDAYDGVEGSSNSLIPFGASWNEYRVMDVYNSSGLDFAGRTRITGFAWRSNTGVAYSGGTFQCDVTLSTTSTVPNSLAMTFDLNHGADKTVVFDGTLTLQSRAGGAGPHPFDHVCHFDTPFEYDPAQGNLVVDVRVHSHDRNNSQGFDAVPAVGNPCGRIYNNMDSTANAAITVAQNVTVRGFLTEPIPTLPGQLDSSFGGFGSVYPFGLAEARAMHLYTDAAFPSDKPAWIRHLAFRPVDSSAPFGPVTYTCTIDLSSSSLATGPLNSVFDNNHGANRRRVFDGKFSVPFLPAGSSAADFPIAVKLDSAFYHDPSTTSLVVDIRVTDTNGDTRPLDGGAASAGHGVWSARAANNANATMAASTANIGLVMRIAGSHDNALAEEYGTGCAGANGVPRCFTEGLPWLPNPDLVLRLRDGASSSVVIAMLGLAPANVPLDLYGLPGCTQWNDQAFGNLLTLSDTNGGAALPLGLPDLPEFAGLPIRQQWACLDPTANVTGVSFSNGQLLQMAR